MRRSTGRHSLGASGAVSACIASDALIYPEVVVVLKSPFLPSGPLEARAALKWQLCHDGAGALLGLGRVDHWGHLGGYAFGIWFTQHAQLGRKPAAARKL